MAILWQAIYYDHTIGYTETSRITGVKLSKGWQVRHYWGDYTDRYREHSELGVIRIKPDGEIFVPPKLQIKEGTMLEYATLARNPKLQDGEHNPLPYCYKSIRFDDPETQNDKSILLNLIFDSYPNMSGINDDLLRTTSVINQENDYSSIKEKGWTPIGWVILHIKDGECLQIRDFLSFYNHCGELYNQILSH